MHHVDFSNSLIQYVIFYGIALYVAKCKQCCI